MSNMLLHSEKKSQSIRLNHLWIVLLCFSFLYKFLKINNPESIQAGRQIKKAMSYFAIFHSSSFWNSTCSSHDILPLEFSEV